MKASNFKWSLGKRIERGRLFKTNYAKLKEWLNKQHRHTHRSIFYIHNQSKLRLKPYISVRIYRIVRSHPTSANTSDVVSTADIDFLSRGATGSKHSMKQFFQGKVKHPPPLQKKKLIWKMKKRSNIDTNCYKQQMFQFRLQFPLRCLFHFSLQSWSQESRA